MAELDEIRVALRLELEQFRQDLNKAQSQMRQAGQGMASSMTPLNSALRSVGASFTRYLAVGYVAHQLTQLGRQALATADEFAKLSAQVGINVDKLDAYAYAAAKSNVSMGELTSGLRFLSRNVREALTNDLSDAADAFRAIGVEIESLRGLRPEQAFEKISAQLREIPAGLQKSAIMQDILGRNGAALAALTNEIDKAEAAMKRFNVVTAEEFQSSSQRYNEASADMQKAQEQLGRVVAQSVEPAIRFLMERFTETTLEVAKFEKETRLLEKAGKGVATFFELLGIGLTVVSARLKEIGTGIGATAAFFGTLISERSLSQAYAVLKAHKEDSKQLWDETVKDVVAAKARIDDLWLNREAGKDERKKDDWVGEDDELVAWEKTTKALAEWEKFGEKKVDIVKENSAAVHQWELASRTAQLQNAMSLTDDLAAQFGIRMALEKESWDERIRNLKNSGVSEAALEKARADAGMRTAEVAAIEQRRIGKETSAFWRDMLLDQQDLEAEISGSQAAGIAAEIQRFESMLLEKLSIYEKSSEQYKQARAAVAQQVEDRDFLLRLGKGKEGSKNFADASLENERMAIELLGTRGERAAASADLELNSYRAALEEKGKLYEDDAALYDQYMEQVRAMVANKAKLLEIEGLSPLQQLSREWNNITDQMEQATANWAQMSIDYIVEFAKTGKFEFKSFAASVLEDIIRIQLQAALFGSKGGKEGAATGLLSAFARYFTGRTGAAGGEFGVGEVGLVGEQGPELIMPKTTSMVLPMSKVPGSGGRATVVNTTINVSTGVQQTVRAEITSLMPQIAEANKRAVMAAINRGGAFAAAVGR